MGAHVMSTLMTTDIEVREAQRTGTPWDSSIPLRSQWELEAFRGVFKAEALKQDWDSYGSPPPTLRALNRALGILRGIAELDIQDLPVPFVVPVHGGGIQLEWTVGGREFELEISRDGSVEYLKAEDREPLEEGRLEPIAEQLRSLFAWLTSAG